MKEFENIPAHTDTKERIANLRYEMQVDSMDAVVRELIRIYDREYRQIRAGANI